MTQEDLNNKKEYIESWLLKNYSADFFRKSLALEYACKRGQLDAVKKLVEHGLECTEISMAYASGAGHLHIVEWLYKNANKADMTLAIKLAVFHGQISIIEWIKKNTNENIDFRSLLPYCGPEIWKVLYEYDYGSFTEDDYLKSVKQGYNNIVKQVYPAFKDNNKLQSKAYKIARQENNAELTEFFKNVNKSKFREILEVFFNITHN